MKALIHIYVDEYETEIKQIKNTDIKIIMEELYTFIQSKGYTFEINLQRYNDPIATRIPEEFMKKYDKEKITFNPFGFHKKLQIMFTYVNADDIMCSCGDVYCYGNCGTLICGCIDLCRGRCGETYDSY